jgi:excisionase family DNA binding protein
MNAAEKLYQSLVEEATAEAERRILEKLQGQIGLLQDRVFNTQEAADYLNLSKKTLYTLCAEKQIRHIPAGSQRSKKPVFLFRQSTLDTWLREQEDKSVKASTA